MAYNINSFGYTSPFLNKHNYDLQIMQTFKKNGYKVVCTNPYAHYNSHTFHITIN